MSVGFNRPSRDYAQLRRCHRCAGSGQAPCQVCFGHGTTHRRTDRFGKPVHDRCDGCFGRKTTRCGLCNGDGFIS
ncbi:hypothetical protein FIU89_02055 [Roseovarius sp. THAF27]|uniref:hypothetical protein n=1 Tax=Roseovarius sp. THAF27 TaxID=2587850 RepID=UPI001269062A|nr:hypothetical protein [Roseovarius sp. THAF27]QFT79379.1 hypothetical protein FIU89_02055 [Roseovarius sp. THAF27]